MKFEEEVTVLTAESKPYSFNGKEGVSHKVRLNILGEIYSISTTEDIVKDFTPLVGQDVKVLLQFTSPKEILKLRILNIVK